MYVCLCRAVTENAIRHAVARGARTFDDLSAGLGVGSQCGTCQCVAEAVLEESLEHRDAPPSASAGRRISSAGA